MICDGCGQSAISTTKAGRPICPDCIDEGYGDECPEPAIAEERYAAGYQAAIDDVVKWLLKGNPGHVEKLCARGITRRFGKDQ